MNRSRWAIFLLLSIIWPQLVRAHDLDGVELAEVEVQVTALVEATHKQLDANQDSSDAWGKMGMVLQAHGFNEAAVIHYEQAIQRAPSAYRWSYLAGEALIGTDLTVAAMFFRSAVEKNATDLALFVRYGDVLTRLGRLGPAKSAYQHAQQLKSESPHAAIGLARLSLVQGDVEDARRLLEQARDRAPGNSEIHTLLAQVYMRTGESRASEQSGLLAKAHKFRSQPASHVIDEMQALAINSDAYETRGNRLLRKGDLNGAVDAYRQVLTMRPNRARDLANLASALAERGDGTQAMPLFEAALELAPNDAFILTQAGRAELAHGSPDRARALFEVAMRINPESADVHLELAKLDLGDNQMRAIEHYERALTLDPSLYRAYLDLGLALYQAGKPGPAQAVWQSLLTIEPDHAGAWRNSGFAFAYEGNYPSAIPALENVIRVDPADIGSSLLLALLLATSEDTTAEERKLALSIATRAYRVQPRDPLHTAILAVAFAGDGQFDKAVEFGQRALDRTSAAPALAETLREHLLGYRQQQPAELPDGGCRTEVGDARLLVCSLIEPR